MRKIIFYVGFSLARNRLWLCFVGGCLHFILVFLLLFYLVYIRCSDNRTPSHEFIRNLIALLIVLNIGSISTFESLEIADFLQFCEVHVILLNILIFL